MLTKTVKKPHIRGHDAKHTPKGGWRRHFCLALRRARRMGGRPGKSDCQFARPKEHERAFRGSAAQPDAALTNIVPVSPNKFRFLFVWPGSNPLMTYDRVGLSFADRFTAFANQLKPLASGFCLPSQSMYFGTTTYGEDEVNVAYRDIEVHYQFGWQPALRGPLHQRSGDGSAYEPASPSWGLRYGCTGTLSGASSSRAANAGGRAEAVYQGASRRPATAIAFPARAEAATPSWRPAFFASPRLP